MHANHSRHHDFFGAPPSGGGTSTTAAVVAAGTVLPVAGAGVIVDVVVEVLGPSPA